MTGVKQIEKPVSSGRKWVNRFFLASGQKFNARKILFGLIVILLILLTTYLRREGYISTEGILNFIKQYKVAAPLFFIFIYAVGPSLFIPSLTYPRCWFLIGTILGSSLFYNRRNIRCISCIPGLAFYS